VHIDVPYDPLLVVFFFLGSRYYNRDLALVERVELEAE